MRRWLCLVNFISLFALAACGGNTTTSDPAPVVEKYLTAMVKADQEGLRALLCAAKEADLEAEATRFISVTGAELQDMACQAEGADTVACTGAIVAQYGTEKTTFPLTRYRVVQEDGEWKYCGLAG